MPTAEPDLSVDSIRSVLRDVWGHEQLRDLQEPAIRAALDGRDSLVVLPTGGGKSLCYQLPPLLTGKPTLIVSPLISLMNDQVASLTASGVPAAALHSGLGNAELRSIEGAFESGELKLLFVAPERLMNPGLLSMAKRAGVACVAIDEAHCISAWGHDFRPEYRQLASIRQRLPDVTLQALTATATPRVREDIIAQLALRDPEVLVGVFDRPNLTYRVLPRVKLEEQVAEIASRHRGSGMGEGEEGVIVYCLSRKDTERLADGLTSRGIDARAYHAGLASKKRSRVERDFTTERVNVVCATVAFGMGIDRSNVRCVIHACLPRSVEAFQQETGRAGRDGLPGECVLLHSPADIVRWSRLIEMPGDYGPPDPDFVKAQLDLLNQMRAIATGGECRHKALSEHFGQTYTPPEGGEGCGACDICLGELKEADDAETVAKKIISCVARFAHHAEATGSPATQFGAKHLVEVLAGARTKRIEQFGHHTLSTYALLSETPRDIIDAFVNQLIDQGALARAPGDRPVIHLTDASREFLAGRRSVRLIEPAVAPRISKRDTASWEGVDRDLFDRLRALRSQIAEDRGVPPYIIFSDNTLRDMARARPSKTGLLLNISGVGSRKLEEFGDAFVEAIVSHCEAGEIEMDTALVDPRPRQRRPAPARSSSSRNEAAYRLLLESASLDTVAEQAGCTTGTAAKRLVELIEEGKVSDISPWVDQETFTRADAAFAELGDERLKPVRDHLDEEIDYDALHIVRAMRTRQL